MQDSRVTTSTTTLEKATVPSETSIVPSESVAKENNKIVPPSSSASSQMFRTEIDRVKRALVGLKQAKSHSGALFVSKNEIGQFEILSNDNMMTWIWHNGLHTTFKQLVSVYFKDHPDAVMYKQGWSKNATPASTNQAAEKPVVLVDAQNSRKLDENLIGILRMKPPTPQIEKLIKKAEKSEKKKQELRRKLESVLELYLNNEENQELQRKKEEAKRMKKKQEDKILIQSLVNDFIEKKKQNEKTSEKPKKGDSVVKDKMEIS